MSCRAQCDAGLRAEALENHKALRVMRSPHVIDGWEPAGVHHTLIGGAGEKPCSNRPEEGRRV